MSTKRTVLVAGATGAQGGAATNALIERGHKVIAIARNPNSDAAKALSSKGVDVRAGDYADAESIKLAAVGADTAFAVSSSYDSGIADEIKNGKQFVSVLAETGIGHIILSTVGGADQNTGISHFDSKYEIEKHLASLGVPFTIQAPVYFMENLLAPWGLPALKEGTFAAGMPGDRILQQIAVKNIGDFASALVERRDSVFGKRFDIAGDELTNDAAVELVSKASGHTVNYQGFPADGLREQSEDLADMFEWFDKVGYSADVAALRKEFSEVPWRTYFDWVAQQDWSILD